MYQIQQHYNKHIQLGTQKCILTNIHFNTYNILGSVLTLASIQYI